MLKMPLSQESRLHISRLELTVRSTMDLPFHARTRGTVDVLHCQNFTTCQMIQHLSSQDKTHQYIDRYNLKGLSKMHFSAFLLVSKSQIAFCNHLVHKATIHLEVLCTFSSLRSIGLFSKTFRNCFSKLWNICKPAIPPHIYLEDDNTQLVSKDDSVRKYNALL
jgi:hypothetical protein